MAVSTIVTQAKETDTHIGGGGETTHLNHGGEREFTKARGTGAKELTTGPKSSP